MSQKVKGTRTRSTNFTVQDQMLLFQCMKPYVHIIESKQTDSVKQVDKQIAWTKITEIFNSNTSCQNRTTENLISCYRNIKSKLKKQQSEAKMLLEDPYKKDALLNALEEHGKDWDDIATSISTPAAICKSGFDELTKLAKKEDVVHKKQILGTGGGPPPSKEDPLMGIKKFIEPQMDGMYTIFDGDAQLMEQFEKTKPAAQQNLPIEVEFLGLDKENLNPIPSTSSFIDSTSIVQRIFEGGTSSSCADGNYGDNNLPQTKLETPKRTDYLRKKRAPELGNDYECSSKKRKNVNDSFLNLAAEKIELLNMQRKLLNMEIQHKSRLYALELEDKINENKFKAELRLKELHLLDLKINKETQ